MADSMLQVYARNVRLWWAPALLQGLLGMAYQAWLQQTMPPLPEGLSPYMALPVLSAFATSGAFWYPLLALLLASMLPFIALVLQFDRLQGGEALSGPRALQRALKLLPGALLAALAYLLVVLGGSLVPMLPGVGLAASLLLLPGAWLGGRWLLWPVALARAGGGLRSLEQGAALIRGRWWRVNSWIAVVVLVAALGMLVVEAVFGSLPGLLVTTLSWGLAAPALPLGLVLAARGREFA